MRILVANNYYYMRGGAERVMFNDMQSLTANGEDVVPFSVSDPANTPSEHSANFAQGVEVHATNPLRKLRAAGEAIHCGRTARAFATVLDKVQPDVLHCHNIYGRLTTSILLVARRRGIPAVLTVHDYKVVCPSYLMLRDGKPCHACVDGNYYRCGAYRCHKNRVAESVVYSAEAYFARLSQSYSAISTFLCPSKFIADLLIRSGIAADRVTYHPNSVDTQSFQPSYEGDYVLYAGRLSREKGISTLIEALTETNIPLRIAGAGPLEASLQAQVDKAGKSNITFEGHCDTGRLARLYQNAAFVVVPSEWYENAPMSILEAFAYGKCVVASNIGGIPELVTDGETGYLFPWGHAADLRSAVSKLWLDAEARRRMGRSARKLAEVRFSQNVRTASLLKIYGSLCS